MFVDPSTTFVCSLAFRTLKTFFVRDTDRECNRSTLLLPFRRLCVAQTNRTTRPWRRFGVRKSRNKPYPLHTDIGIVHAFTRFAIFPTSNGAREIHMSLLGQTTGRKRSLNREIRRIKYRILRNAIVSYSRVDFFEKTSYTTFVQSWYSRAARRRVRSPCVRKSGNAPLILRPYEQRRAHLRRLHNKMYCCCFLNMYMDESVRYGRLPDNKEVRVRDKNELRHLDGWRSRGNASTHNTTPNNYNRTNVGNVVTGRKRPRRLDGDGRARPRRVRPMVGTQKKA